MNAWAAGRTEWLHEIAGWDDQRDVEILRSRLVVEVDLVTGIAYTRALGRPLDDEELSPWRRK